MPTTLTAAGTRFDPDDFFVDGSTLPIAIVFRRGEPTHANSRTSCPRSGVMIWASEAEFERFDDQVSETARFLTDYRNELARLRAFRGVEEMWVDFGVGWLDDHAAFYRFPAEFIALATSLRLGIELSRYPTESTLSSR